MKIRNVLIALALVAAPSVVEAQCMASPCSIAMGAGGTIRSSVTLSVAAPLAFGTLVNGANAANGEFQIASNQDVSVTVSFLPLVHTTIGTAQLTLSGTCSQGTTFASATAFATGCGTAEPVTFAGLGTKSVYVAGAVTVNTATDPAGGYVGSATMTTTFTSY